LATAGEMSGRLHAFDARGGGGYRMSLVYPPDESAARGRASEREDLEVGSVDLERP
jgi:hypothetical protein